MTEAPVALCCGEPAGIGPELAVKAWRALRDSCPFAWIGDPSHLGPDAPVREISSPNEANGVAAEAIPVLRHEFPAKARPGRPDPANAQSTVDAISRAVNLADDGAVSAICTGPVSKEILVRGAGFAHAGQTGYLAELAGARRAVMMLACDRLRVVPATVHVPLADVPRLLNRDLLRETVEIAARDLRARFGVAAPRIAVAGLNPHAGEDGLIGTEERDWIAPLVAEMRSGGLDVDGPHPADTLFRPAALERHDAVVCMYHDQALIPIKTLDFAKAVNVTLGLPFVRTSPDHGTAFDIAGKGIADPGSMIEALRLARRLANAGKGGPRDASRAK